MRAWPVPTQMTGEEKYVGGILSLRQLGYLIAGLALGGRLAVFMRHLPLIAHILIFLIGQGVGVILAFFEIDDTPLDVYLYHYLRWRLSPRKAYLRGDE